MMPRAANMAMRPLFSSRFRISVSYMPRPTGSPKSPTSLLGSCAQTESSMKPESKRSTTTPPPPSGVVTAERPLGTVSKPGNLT